MAASKILKCQAILKSGSRKGQECGIRSKYTIPGGNFCGRHYRPPNSTAKEIHTEREGKCTLTVDLGGLIAYCNKARAPRQYYCSFHLNDNRYVIECYYPDCTRRAAQCRGDYCYCDNHADLKLAIVGQIERSQILWGRNGEYMFRQADRWQKYGTIVTFRLNTVTQGIFTLAGTGNRMTGIINYQGQFLDLHEYRVPLDNPELHVYQDEVYLLSSRKGLDQQKEVIVLDFETLTVKEIISTEILTPQDHPFSRYFTEHYLVQVTYLLEDEVTNHNNRVDVFDIHSRKHHHFELLIGRIRGIYLIPDLDNTDWYAHNMVTGQKVKIPDSIDRRTFLLRMISSDGSLIVYSDTRKLYYQYNNQLKRIDNIGGYRIYYDGCYIVTNKEVIMPHMDKRIKRKNHLLIPTFTGPCRQCLIPDSLQKRCVAVVRRFKIDSSPIPKIIKERFYLV